MNCSVFQQTQNADLTTNHSTVDRECRLLYCEPEVFHQDEYSLSCCTILNPLECLEALQILLSSVDLCRFRGLYS